MCPHVEPHAHSHTHTHTCTHAHWYRLQTGMRGAFGKPQGTVARVHIGQVIMSIRSKENHLATCLEALRRAKFKYPGRQKVRRSGSNNSLLPHNVLSSLFQPLTLQIYISNKWGFTKWTKEQYKEMMEDGRLVSDGVHVQYKPSKGPLIAWKKRQTA